MNLEYIKKEELILIELINKYFDVLNDYVVSKGKINKLPDLYEEIRVFYLKVKNKFIKKKYGGMVTENDRCIICLGEAEEDNLLYSHERIDLRGEDGNPITKNSACFFHVNCLKQIVKYRLNVDESEIDNYFIECPMCKSVLTSSKLENYENDKKRFVAIKKTNNNMLDFRNIPADFDENRVFSAVSNRFVHALLMLLWLLFIIAVYYQHFVNQENTNINQNEQDLNNLFTLSDELDILSSYARRDQNEAIRVLNNLVATFYDNINYENRVILDDNMDNNDEFVEAFRIALNEAIPDHQELGGKKKRKKKSMKKKTKNKRSKKNKTKKKGGSQDILKRASEIGAEELFKRLLYWDHVNDAEELHLVEASRSNNVKLVRLLLEIGADINRANSAGETPLYVASEMSNVEMVRILLEKGADINKAESNGQTPLMIAVASGHFEVVEVLLEYGANLNAKTNEGYTAFDMVNERVFPEIATLLKTSQQKNLATKNIKEYKRPIPSLRSLAYRQLDTESTSEINKNKNMLLPPSKVGGKGKKTKKKKN